MMLRLRRLWMQLTADRRKFGVLCFMVAIGLLLWARLIVVSNMPRTAVADDPATPSVPVPVDPAPPDNPTPTVTAVTLESRPKCDPFEISAAHFPKPTLDDELPADPEKSTTEQTEDPEQVEARFREHLQTLVAKYRLEAAMPSASLAVISGRTYRTGARLEVAEGERFRFTLAEVKQRTVILEYEGRRFELEMGAPGG